MQKISLFQLYYFVFYPRTYRLIRDIACHDFTYYVGGYPGNSVISYMDTRQKNVEYLGIITPSRETLYQLLYQRRIRRYLADCANANRLLTSRGIPVRSPVNDFPMISLKTSRK